MRNLNVQAYSEGLNVAVLIILLTSCIVVLIFVLYKFHDMGTVNFFDSVVIFAVCKRTLLP